MTPFVVILSLCVFLSLQSVAIVWAVGSPHYAFEPQNSTLFAVLSGTNCANNLAYGPSLIDINGEVGGPNSAYLSTNTSGKDLLHQEWVQIVTSDGVEELFRVYWTFATARKLEDHFVAASSEAQTVSYRVVEPDGTIFEYEGEWQFQSSQMDLKFLAPETSSGFGWGQVVWGAFQGLLFYHTAWPTPLTPLALSGVYNYDDLGEGGCSYIHWQGKVCGYYPQTKTYLYYTGGHNLTPDMPPVAISPNVTMRVRQRLLGLAFSSYAPLSEAWNIVIKSTIAINIEGALYEDVTSLVVFDMPKIENDYYSSPTIGLHYTVSIPKTRNRTYEDMSEDIMYSTFAEVLNLYADTQGLERSAYIYSLDTYTEDAAHRRHVHHERTVNTGAVVGLSIGTCAALLCMCYYVPYLCKKLCLRYVLPQLERLEERDLEMQSVHPQRNPFDLYAHTYPLPPRPRAVRPVPTVAVTVSQISSSDYHEVAIAEVQVVGAVEDMEDVE